MAYHGYGTAAAYASDCSLSRTPSFVTPAKYVSKIETELIEAIAQTAYIS